MGNVKIKDKGIVVDDNTEALVLAIQELTNEIKRLAEHG